MRHATRQRGLVLITAVLIVAILATLATFLSLGQQMWLRQTENMNGRAQTESLRQGALAWIGILLARDARDNKVDHLGELWAGQLPPLPAEGGVLAVKLTDAQSLFNLNNLVRAGQASANDVAAFQRLLAAEKLDPLLANALVDWLDTNADPLSGGGEDVDYLARAPSYRVANQALTSVDELRLVSARGTWYAGRPVMIVSGDRDLLGIGRSATSASSTPLRPCGRSALRRARQIFQCVTDA